jgi:hypothetical protein
MIAQKLTNLLEIISEKLIRENIPFSVIGAMALAAYGFPRYTSDIDLLTEGCYWPQLLPLAERLGYTCYQKTAAFAQFDSEMGVYASLDFMFVNTQDGKDILERRIVVSDKLLKQFPVIQPNDYIILKLMAIANNPHRSIQDEADIFNILKLYSNHLIPQTFEALDTDRICRFADRFRQRECLEKYLNMAFTKSCKTDSFEL